MHFYWHMLYKPYLLVISKALQKQKNKNKNKTKNKTKTKKENK